MRRFLRNNGLSVAAFGLFLLFVVGQILAGNRAYNEEQVEHGEAPVSVAGYLKTSHFGEAIFENWESEFLQMGGYVLLTVWLRQRGSAESKKFDEPEPVDEDPVKHKGDSKAPWPVRRGGLALAFYRSSLTTAFLGCFALSWLLHAMTGAHAYSSEQQAHGEAAVTTLQYMARSQFWFESFQNWQSEFLAVAAIVVLSIFLRQQGSPESKPVHAPHTQTGE